MTCLLRLKPCEYRLPFIFLHEFCLVSALKRHAHLASRPRGESAFKSFLRHTRQNDQPLCPQCKGVIVSLFSLNSVPCAEKRSVSFFSGSTKAPAPSPRISFTFIPPINERNGTIAPRTYCELLLFGFSNSFFQFKY